MKKYLVLFISIIILSACNSSNEEGNNFDSNILVDSIEFIPTKAILTNATANISGESAKNFVLSKGSEGTSTYESINFTINYSQTSSSAPNGVYEFGIGTIGEVTFAQGFYIKGSTAYSLAGYTVQVTALSTTTYRLDFQNIQAVNPLNGNMIIISGFFQGKMK